MVRYQKNVFITFGAGRSGWIGAAKRITAEAEKTGLFEFCFNLDEKWHKTWDPEVYEIGLNIRKYQTPRGFGYWTWKPSVLMWAHLNFPNHQIVYVDAGSQFYQENLLELKSDLDASFSNRGLAWTRKGHPEEVWSKADLLTHLNVSREIALTDQVQSGFISLSPNWDRGAFISQWREIVLVDSGWLFTDVSRNINSNNFVEHRHDQSALSCLWKLHALPLIEDKTHPSHANKYPLLAWRNNNFFRVESNTFLHKSSKVVNLIIDLIKHQS